MRTIKFRAYVDNKQNRYMAIQGEPDLETLSSFMFHYGSENNLMQFTGLQDKNGNDIYEGDILKSECGKLGKIEWLNNRTAFCVHWYLQLGSGDIEYCVLNLKLEIIGNKYENPELLSTPTAVLSRESFARLRIS